jgi:hypothetical protein
MTKILYSGLVSDNRGKLNGSIFSKNRTGNIIKNFSSPRNPQSGTQQPNRANWKYIVNLWGSLSTEQRASWSDLAATVTWRDKIGTPFHPTGQMLYLYCNQNLFSIGVPMLLHSVAPVAKELISTCGIGQHHSGTWGAFLTFTPSPTSATIYYKVFATPCLSPGISYAKKWFRQIGVLAPATTSGIDITAMYLSVFPSPVSDKRIFIKLVPVESTSGFSSLPVFADFITVVPVPVPHLPFAYLTFSYSF